MVEEYVEEVDSWTRVAEVFVVVEKLLIWEFTFFSYLAK